MTSAKADIKNSVKQITKLTDEFTDAEIKKIS
jgi:hypothetical protein